MDRDNRWERIQKAYDVMVKGIGTETEDVLASIAASYEAGVTDEFIEPLLVTENGKPVATIEEGDVVLCFNYSYRPSAGNHEGFTRNKISQKMV